MKRWVAGLGLMALLATPAGAWRPAGWVYHDHPWAFDAATGDWYWLNTVDTQWVARMDSGQWARLPDSLLATGWVFYEWPYAVSGSQGVWHWINEGDVQWVVNMRTGDWSRFGRESAPPDSSEGIFADFRTSMGPFTVRLDYGRAPRAVAGFIGLATGEAGWLDAQSNVWHRPFYDGTIFHRIAATTAGVPLAVQGGGRPVLTVNTNTGAVTTNFTGPGYGQPENVANGLLHSNGVISMANSGPNTDGSQFFLTVTNVTMWDGSYSVFGNVVSGMAVVAAMSAAPVPPGGSRPLEDIVIEGIGIRRAGAAAEAFDAGAQGVPVPECAPMRAYRDGTELVLEMELGTQTQPLLFSESPDLGAWERSVMIPGLDYYTGATQVLTNRLALADLGDRYFFHAGRIRYPVPVTTSTRYRGRLFTFWWDTVPPVKYEVMFSTNWPYQGIYQVTTTNVVQGYTFVGDEWAREAYSARLAFMDNTGTYGRDYYYSLGFNPGAATNRFTCTVRNWISLSDYTVSTVGGVFTLGD